MHLRIRDSSYFDRRLQMSNRERRLLVASVTSQLLLLRQEKTHSSAGGNNYLETAGGESSTSAPDVSPQAKKDDITTEPSGALASPMFDKSWRRRQQPMQPAHSSSSLSILLGDDDVHYFGRTPNASSPVTGGVERTAAVEDGNDGVDSVVSLSLGSSMWNQRSVATPQKNYVSIARRQRTASALDGSSCNNGSESDALRNQDRYYRPSSTPSSLTGYTASSPVAHRVVLIKLQPGTGGLDPILQDEHTTFGVGTAGLGAARCEHVIKDVRSKEREDWGVARDKWAHDDQQRDAARYKKWSASSRTKSVSEIRNMKYEVEFRKSELVKESKDASKALAEQAQIAREDLTLLEHNNVRELRQNALEESIRRREKNEQHAAALQHLGRLENASRKLSSMNAAEENATRIRRLQRRHAADRNTSAAQRDSARASILGHRQELAAQLRAKEVSWEKRAKFIAKTESDEAKTFVKKLHESVQSGPRNARALLEYKNSQRRESLKKAHEALEALVLERRENVANAAREIAEVHRNEERQRREASAQRFGRGGVSGRRSSSSSSDGGNSC